MRVIKEYNKFLETKEFQPKTYEETALERIKAIHQNEEQQA